MGNRDLSLCLVFIYFIVLQSCSKESGLDKIAEIPFVVETVEDMKLLKSVGFYLNAENIAALPEATDGACGIGTFDIDFSRHVDSIYYNAEAKSWKWVPVEDVIIKDNSDPVAADTFAIEKGASMLGSVLFLGGTHVAVEGGEYRYQLSYDGLRIPTGNNYQFDLNVLRETETATPNALNPEKTYVAFDLDKFLKKYDVPGVPDTFNIGVKFCPGWTVEGLYKYDSIKITPAVIIP